MPGLPFGWACQAQGYPGLCASWQPAAALQRVGSLAAHKSARALTYGLGTARPPCACPLQAGASGTERLLQPHELGHEQQLRSQPLGRHKNKGEACARRCDSLLLPHECAQNRSLASSLGAGFFLFLLDWPRLLCLLLLLLLLHFLACRTWRPATFASKQPACSKPRWDKEGGAGRPNLH